MKLHNDYKGFLYILFVLFVNMLSNINCEECVVQPITFDYIEVLPHKSYITSLGNDKCV